MTFSNAFPCDTSPAMCRSIFSASACEPCFCADGAQISAAGIAKQTATTIAAREKGCDMRKNRNTAKSDLCRTQPAHKAASWKYRTSKPVDSKTLHNGGELRQRQVLR